MSESRKGKFALSGLGKGSSSGGSFRSFRFSPENEEIEEIMLQDPTAEEKTQSQPDSPKPSGGDVSPLKEILKHKLANKLEKRSLSFDLDLKGKLINVFEDKRKSIVSHFIPEETGIIPPTTSIAEHIGYAGDVDSVNGAVVKTTSESTDGFLDLNADVEEVGTDFCASANLQEEIHLEQVLKFNVSPEYLQEYYGGYSPIYHQHPRQYAELPLFNSIVQISDEDLKPVNILKNIFSALVSHVWTKYLVCLIGITLFIPFGTVFVSPFLWIIVGGVAVIIFQESLLTPHSVISAHNSDNNKTIKSESNDPQSPSAFAAIQSVEMARNPSGYNFNSQGWMTEFDGEYDAFTCNVRLTRLVFVRLDRSLLYVSYPHPKHRIPKRRLWNDPQITVEHTFLRHCVYNLLGATISIAPERLARKRAWNKKYPIAVRLPHPSVVTVVSPSASTEGIGTTDTNVSEESASVATGEKKVIEPKKEITREDCSFKTIYLFSRTDREKDDWFRRLVAAAKSSSSNPATPESRSTATPGTDPTESLHDYLEYMRKIIPSVGESSEGVATPVRKLDGKDKSGGDAAKKDASEKSESSSSSSKIEDTPASSRKGSPVLEDSVLLEKIFTVPQSPAFLNAFLGRIFYDFLRTPYWKTQVNDLIQKKLNYIRRPQFLETLVVRDLDLGTTIPIIQRASNPVFDSQGLWIDLDLSYDGNIVVTLETKINLLKLRKSPSQETPDDSGQSQNVSNNHLASIGSSQSTSVNFSSATDSTTVSIKKSSHNSTTSLPGAVSSEMSCSTTSSGVTGNASNSSTPLHAVANMFDSDADDSGESSEDEMNPDDFLAPGSDSMWKEDAQNSGDSKGKKILKMAEKIASSKYVQHATEMKVVKKAIANVANTPIVLAVELKSLNGTLALNIAPPPTDRLWMGFRHNPSMQISAKPKFGARAVNLTHVTDWIQKKLLHEFQRVIVFPNMNDVTIPLMEFKLPK